MKQIEEKYWAIKTKIAPKKKSENKRLLYLILAIAMAQLSIMLILSYYYLH